MGRFGLRPFCNPQVEAILQVGSSSTAASTTASSSSGRQNSVSAGRVLVRAVCAALLSGTNLFKRLRFRTDIWRKTDMCLVLCLVL